MLHESSSPHVPAIGRQVLQSVSSSLMRSRTHPQVKPRGSLLRLHHRSSDPPVGCHARGPHSRSHCLLVVDLVDCRAHARLAFCRA
eukprot:620499-Hanusia_phi.AAC.2